jgi:hypothetical protein
MKKTLKFTVSFNIATDTNHYPKGTIDICSYEAENRDVLDIIDIADEITIDNVSLVE